ncbi:calcium-binding protein [Streptomyces sp. NPDC001530]|uniref:calcium-binding protein n=1 Tax=Streptomyces sp. NPDC001530 TaxID=3364582 RepID=UPI003698E1FB
MRKRTTTVALLAAFTAAGAVLAPAAFADGSQGDTTITKVVVNGGKNVVIGATTAKTFTVSVTATDNEGIAGADITLNGPNYGIFTTSSVTCVAASATTSTCSASFTVDPRVYDISNDQAGTWYVDAWVDAKGDDSNFIWKEKAGSFKVQRASKLTVNASPEPVVKGRTVTVTGKLSRANWEDGLYHGYTNQSVKLQFRKAGTSTYTTLKTITSDSTGNLKTTTTAGVDGYYRFSFAGTSTTPAANATGDYVDVQ